MNFFLRGVSSNKSAIECLNFFPDQIVHSHYRNMACQWISHNASAENKFYIRIKELYPSSNVLTDDVFMELAILSFKCCFLIPFSFKIFLWCPADLFGIFSFRSIFPIPIQSNFQFSNCCDLKFASALNQLLKSFSSSLIP